jgi:hypothetical protein
MEIIPREAGNFPAIKKHVRESARVNPEVIMSINYPAANSAVLRTLSNRLPLKRRRIQPGVAIK